MKAKRKPAAKKRLKAKRDRKTQTVSFRVTQEFADEIAAAVAESPHSFSELFSAGVLSVVLNIEAYEVGRLRGHQEAFDEIATEIFGHAKEVDRHAQTLRKLFADTWAVNDTEKGKT